MEIVRGALKTLFYRVGGILVWALIGVVTARSLSVADRGTYASMVVLLFIVASLTPGISDAAGYFVSKKQHPPGEIMAASMILAFGAGTILFVVLAAWGSVRWDDRTLIPIIGLGLFPQIARLALSSIFVGRGYLSRGALGTHGQAYWALLFIAVWVIVLDHRTAEDALGAYVAAQYVALVGLIALAEPEWRRDMLRVPSLATMRAMVMYGSLPGVATLVAMTNQRLGQILVIRLDGAVGAGIYASAVTIAEGLLLFSSSIAMATYHRIGTLPPDEAAKLTARAFRNTVPVIAAPALVIVLLAPWLISGLYGSRYEDGATTLRLLALATAVFAPVSLLSTYFLVQLGRPVFRLALTSVSAVVNIGLALLLIPQVGYVGAAWAALGSYSLTALIAVMLFLRRSGLSSSELWRMERSDLEGYRSFVRQLRRGRLVEKNEAATSTGSPG